jgi:hypothetical protein
LSLPNLKNEINLIYLEVTKPNGDTLIHEAAIYDSADCLIELAAQGLPINVKNNLMRTPLYLAEKKKSKYAYEALINLEKAIMMSNAFTERKYFGEKPGKFKKYLTLKSSIKNEFDVKRHKTVRIKDKSDHFVSSQEENQANSPDEFELIARSKQLQNLEKLINLRESLRSSKTSLDNFSKGNHVDPEQTEILKEILQREKEEIAAMEEQLAYTSYQKRKERQTEYLGQVEKVKRWGVIDQKRQFIKEQRSKALEEDKFEEAEKVVEQQEKELQAREIELSSATDEEERERRAQQREQEGKFVTFKKFLDDKQGKEGATGKPKVEKSKQQKDDEVVLRESKQQFEDGKLEEVKEVQEESDIDDELDFTNKNRSFDKHPLEQLHDSKLDEEDEEDIRMSKSTLRQIKVKKRNRSEGPPGRSYAYFNARSLAEKGVTKLSSLLSRFKQFLSEKYHNLKNWVFVEDEEPSRPKKKRIASEEKKKLPKIEEMKINGQDIVQVMENMTNYKSRNLAEERKERPPSKGRSMAEVLKKQRTYGKTAEQLLFENDSDFEEEEQPSVILKKEIQRLKDEELKLKEFELQIEKDINELKRKQTKDDIDAESSVIQEKLAKRKTKKTKKKKKSKQQKVYHDMKKMKQQHIKKILNQDFEVLSDINKKKSLFTKDFKSDHESASPERNLDLEENVLRNASNEALDINVGPLEASKSSTKVKIDNLKVIVVEEKKQLSSPKLSDNALLLELATQEKKVE